jgi:3-dehydrosphinganine reductase
MIIFARQLVLVTGGSSGIGLELAKQLAQLGANVWILARRPDLLQSALAEIEHLRVRPDQTFGFLVADISVESEINPVLDNFLKTTGTPDLLINCVGISRPGLILEQETEIFHRLINTNYLGTIHVVKRIAPPMVQRRSGHIVNLSSIAGFLGIVGYGGYGASKYAIAGFTDVLRIELKPYHILVSIVYPPDTDTPGFEEDQQFLPDITRQLSADNNKVLPPQEVAAAIIKGIKKDQYVILPGFETALQWHLINIFGDLRYFIMDQLIAASQRKLDRKIAQTKP